MDLRVCGDDEEVSAALGLGRGWWLCRGWGLGLGVAFPFRHCEEARTRFGATRQSMAQGEPLKHSHYGSPRFARDDELMKLELWFPIRVSAFP